MRITRWLLTILLLICFSVVYVTSQADSKNLFNNPSPKQKLLVTNQNPNENNLLPSSLLKGITFSNHQLDLSNLRASSIKSADLDQDGDFDIILSNENSNSISILLNDGKGSFLSKDLIFTEVDNIKVLTIADIDADKDLDIAAISSTGSLALLINDSTTGNFISKSLLLSELIEPSFMVSGDVDNDGDIDLIVANQRTSTVTLLSNNGKGEFDNSNTKLIPVLGADSLEIGDLNNDGALDLVLASRDNSSIIALTNNGLGQFNSNYISLDKTPLFANLGDLNKDGNSEIVTINQDGTISVLSLNSTNEIVISNIGLPDGAVSPTSLALADLDKDGDLDIITANEGSNISIFANNNGVFTGANFTLNQRNKPFSIIATDLNGDKYLDLATTNQASNSVNLLLNIHPNNATAQTLPFTQNWSNTGLITADDNWNNVPGIVGYRGDDITAAVAADPQTLLGEGTVTIDVIANQSNPNGLATGGVAEFDGIANPSVALQGSGTADAPNLIITLNTTGFQNINVAYNLRDLDGSTDNAVQAVALQYRVGTTGNFTNVPAGFVSDATQGPNLATLVTPVSATLPSAANNQSTVQVRVITSNATGNDEWVGVDDINITGTAIAQPGSLQFSSATYSVAENGGSATITVTRTNGSNGSVTVDYATSNGTATAGSDYTSTSGTLTFGDGVTSQTFSVPVLDDFLAEGNETVNLALSSPTGGATLGTPNTAVLTITNVPKPGSLQFSSATYSVAENGGSATITVTRTNGSEGSVTVNYATSNGTATAGSDYTSTSGTLTFGDGVTSQTFSVPVLTDALTEGNETVNLALSNPTGGATLGTPNTAVLTITDVVVAQPGSLQFSSATYSIAENGGSATITVTRTNGSNGSVTVGYATSNGTATAGSDYTSTSGTLTFGDGVTSQTFSVPVLDDFLAEGNETVNLALSNPTGGATLGTPNTAVLTITNVPKPGSLQFSSATYSIAENGGSATITVTRTNGSEGSVTVNYATSNGTATAGSDYTSTSGTLTFGDGVTSQTFSVPVLDDLLAEPNETVNLALSNPTGGATLGTPNTAVLTITNVPKPGSLQFSSATYSVAENGGSATITVTRTNGSEGSVTVGYATSNGTATAGSDYTSTSGTLTFGNGVTSQTFSLPISDDLIDENDETVNLALSNPTGGATLGTPSTAVLTIVDNDPPANLSINDLSISEGNNGTTTATFTVSLTPASGLTVIVSFATANGTATSGSDYAATSGTLTFAPGVTSQTISVTINGDVTTENNETFFVNLSSAINAVISDSQGLGTITNDDVLEHFTIYAADSKNNRIQRSTNNGTSWTVLGSGLGVGLGQFNNPRGVTSNFADTLVFVADTGNNRIQRSTNGGLNWQVIAGAGLAVGTVNGPQALAYDEPRDRLYIADTLNNRIQVVNGASTASPTFAIFADATVGAIVGKFNQPRGLAVDLVGNVYVADTLNNRIQVNIGGVWSIFAGATAGTAVGKVNAPRGIFVNALGRVYVADTSNSRIQVFDGTLWSNFMTSGVTVGSVNLPEGVTVTAFGQVIVGDTANNRVQSKDVSGSTATVIGFTGLGANQFNQPVGIR